MLYYDALYNFVSEKYILKRIMAYKFEVSIVKFTI